MAAAMTPHSIPCIPPFRHKRRAPSPPAELPTSPGPSNWNQPKRRKPNLAHGFSSLSLSGRPDDPESSQLPTYEQSQSAERLRKQVDDDDDEVQSKEVEIEEMPRKRTRALFDSGSSDSDDDGYWPKRRPIVQADTIEEPTSPPKGDIDIEEVFDRKHSMDDIDMDRGRKRSRWYEPEKDRIVYTSLSPSSRSSSRSASPEVLSQPGDHGFTISPSMLTRILAAQQGQTPPFPLPQEQGLVLYRPLGSPPGKEAEWRSIVQQWQGAPPLQDDSSRFEVVEDDEVGVVAGLEQMDLD